MAAPSYGGHEPSKLLGTAAAEDFLQAGCPSLVHPKKLCQSTPTYTTQLLNIYTRFIKQTGQKVSYITLLLQYYIHILVY